MGEPGFVSYPCTPPGPDTTALGRIGLRLTRIIVAGRTVLLPTGGKIMDAVMDTIRGKLYLPNIDSDRIEIFELATTFQTAAVWVRSRGA